MKIGVLGDIHHGRNSGETAGEIALPLLSKILAEIQNAGVDLIVDLGDRINDQSPSDDKRLTAEVGASFAHLTAPRFHILGNHDTVNLDRSEIDAALGLNSDSVVVRKDDWDLVMWSPVIRKNDRGKPFAGDPDLAWLEDNVSSESRTIVFTHFPLDRQDSEDNWYFHNYPHLATFANLDSVASILQRKAGLVAVVSGHSHWNSLCTRHDVHFIGLPAVSSTFATGEADAAWTLIELNTELSISVHGRKPRDYRLPIRVKGTRWATPRPV